MDHTTVSQRPTGRRRRSPFLPLLATAAACSLQGVRGLIPSTFHRTATSFVRGCSTVALTTTRRPLSLKATERSGSVLTGVNGVNGDVTATAEATKAAVLATAEATEAAVLAPIVNVTAVLESDEDKRVLVTIRYSGESGLRPFYLTVAQKIKAAHPDVVLEKRILPVLDEDSSSGEATFEVLVDGKVIVGKQRTKRPGVRRSGGTASGAGGDLAGGRSVYVSMDDLGVAVSKARRRRRPTTLYSDQDDAPTAAMRLKALRRQKTEKGDN